jgi:homoserine O-acetyltransferase
MTELAVVSRSTRYELAGPPGAPLVVALGGISASRRVAAWWGESVAGRGGFIDTTRFQLLGIDYADSGAGDDGRPGWAVTTHDQADALAAALDEVGIRKIHTLIGASYGGMVALAYAERHPERVGQLVVISAPARAHPMSTALRAIQRRIVELGLETGRARDALALARSLAMTTYRSAAEFASRFATDPFDADAYVAEQGARFAARFQPARFLALSLSCDLHAVDATRIATPALLLAADGDTIVPRAQMEQLAVDWGGHCRLVHVPANTGHDAFLAESHLFGPLIQRALNSSVLS